MMTVNMHEAKSQLSRLVEALESGREDEIVIARNGQPVARLTRFDASTVGQRIGVAKGLFEVPDDIDEDNSVIADLFVGRMP